MDTPPKVVLALLGLGIFFLIMESNYLFFHTVVEGFAVLVSLLIYILATGTFKHAENTFLFFVGHGYLFVAIIDFAHLLTYSGMNIFPGYTADTPTQLWVAGRLLEAVTLFTASFFINRPFATKRVIGIYSLVTASLLLSIMVFRNFPSCFIPGTGLTVFKNLSEYLICLILLLGMHRIKLAGDGLAKPMHKTILKAMLLTVLAELCFTLYNDVYGAMNFWGHLLKVGSYLAVYQGIVWQGLEEPFELISMKLRKSMAMAEYERRRLEAILEFLPVGVFIADSNGEIIAVNQETSRIWGQVPEVKGMKGYGQFRAWRTETNQQIAPEEWALAKALNHGEAIREEELKIETFNGETKFILNYAVPIRDEDDWIQEVVVVNVDITERKRLTSALRLAEAQRQEAAKNFINVMVHELRNPLTAIRAMCSLVYLEITRKELPADLQSKVGLIESEAEYLGSLLAELSEAFKSGRGELKLEQSTVNLGGIVSRVVEPIRALYPKVNYNCPEDLYARGILVKGDGKRLEEVLRNLLANAGKYSPIGGDVNVDLRIKGDKVLVVVEDTGIGIPADQLELIFNGFFRASNLRQKDPGGMGLGLYICKHIVEAHGGTIWAESLEGAGSTFYCQLPLLSYNQSLFAV